MDEREEIIRRYCQAYNGFDVDGMIADLSPDIVFRNIADGVVTHVMTGIGEFRKQSVEATGYFSKRQLTPVSFDHEGDVTNVNIDYMAVLAVDFPNGMKKGETLTAEGKSVFKFEGGKILELTDIS